MPSKSHASKGKSSAKSAAKPAAKKKAAPAKPVKKVAKAPTKIAQKPAAKSVAKKMTQARFEEEPTLEEIAEYEARREEVRQRWSEEEQYARFNGPKTQKFTLRTFGFSPTDFACYEMPTEL